MADYRVSVVDVRKSYGGVEVLHGVSLDVASGSVLALLGENGAGKSTLVKILAGDQVPDQGQIITAGLSVGSLTPASAHAAGIRMIHQELAGAPTLSVAENISLGVWPRRYGLVDKAEMLSRAASVLSELGANLELDAPVGSLRIGERQIVEIARALSGNARCLILDEPTAALSHHESERLFAHLEHAKQQGLAIIYITHRLEEVQRLADKILVLRDGYVVLGKAAANVTRREIVSAMIGRDTGEVRRPEIAARRTLAPVLTLSSASSGSSFANVSLVVRPGEIVGLYGKVGAGAEEVLAAVFGVRKLDSGTIVLDESTPAPTSPREAIEVGVGSLPSDRKSSAMFAQRSVAENLCAPSWRSLSNRFGILSGGVESSAFDRWKPRMRIRSTGGAGQSIGMLSGGNQQKVLLARWMESKSRVLLLAEPTRGVDVGARQDIYAVLRQMAADGHGVLVATSDYEEVVQLVDRAYVMARGRITTELDGSEISIQGLAEAAGE